MLKTLKYGQSRFFSIDLGAQQLLRYFLDRSEANKLFKEIEIKGMGATIQKLDTLYEPEKLSKTFKLLDLNVSDIRINSWHGYYIKVDSQTKNHIETILGKQLKPAEPESSPTLTNSK